MTEIERFWNYIDKSAGPDACWPWTAGCCSRGYGQFMKKTPAGGYRAILAHRLAYQLTKGEIPAGMELLHKCDCRPCCNPAHLKTGTHYENMLDAATKGRTSQKWISPEAVREIRALIVMGVRLVDIAKEFGVSSGAISSIKAGRTHARVQSAQHKSRQTA